MLPLLLGLAVLSSSPRPLPATNTRCPVTGAPVNRLIHRTVTVRGRDYLVFDHRAGVLLKRWPEGYLRADGVPLNAVPMPSRP